MKTFVVQTPLHYLIVGYHFFTTIFTPTTFTYMHTCTQSVICKVNKPQSIFLHNSVQQNFTQANSHDIIVLNVCFEDTGLSVSISYRQITLETHNWNSPIIIHMSQFHFISCLNLFITACLQCK